MRNQVVVFAAILGFCGSATQVFSQQTDWSAARKLPSGAEITVRLDGLPEVGRSFVSATDSAITVLNLSDAVVPDSAAHELRQLAIDHPEYFDAVANGNTIVFRHLRLTPEGLFSGDHQVVSLSRLVETADRSTVAEITIRRRGRGLWGHLGPLGGYFVGAFGGGIASGLVCQAFSGRDRCDTGAFLAGSLVGGVAGAAYGAVAAHRQTMDVVYRAPREALQQK